MTCVIYASKTARAAGGWGGEADFLIRDKSVFRVPPGATKRGVGPAAALKRPEEEALFLLAAALADAAAEGTSTPMMDICKRVERGGGEKGRGSRKIEITGSLKPT